ncbi:hypothetical protein DXG01_012722 [Tephrocybe rancida]|nr:hypothetical protein DXG01_012722 [Tephrocybe rancida]
MYRHNIFRVNYTSYDLRRSEDVIHVKTSHRNIMVLNPLFVEDGVEHPFWYACVLGIYHANVLYLGEGNADYRPRRVEFLWVRWYSHAASPSPRRLDEVRFPPFSDSATFGFIDPSDVLRGCHIIPRFLTGKTHSDIRSFSSLAKDLEDWKSYYINRDMVMRYYWGLAVGHIYARPKHRNLPINGQTLQGPDEEEVAPAEVTPQTVQLLDLDDLLATLETIDGMDEVEAPEDEPFDEERLDDSGDEWVSDAGEEDGNGDEGEYYSGF